MYACIHACMHVCMYVMYLHIRKDKVIEVRRPGIVVDQRNCETVIIDVAVPADFSVIDRESKNTDLLSQKYIICYCSRSRWFSKSTSNYWMKTKVTLY